MRDQVARLEVADFAGFWIPQQAGFSIVVGETAKTSYLYALTGRQRIAHGPDERVNSEVYISCSIDATGQRSSWLDLICSSVALLVLKASALGRAMTKNIA